MTSDRMKDVTNNASTRNVSPSASRVQRKKKGREMEWNGIIERITGQVGGELGSGEGGTAAVARCPVSQKPTAWIAVYWWMRGGLGCA